MKKLIATSVVLTAFGVVAACSQGDTHPPFISDCDACGHQPIISGGDAATDTKPDAQTADSGGKDSSANDSSTSDASSDASDDGNDGALLDTGTGD